MKKTIVVALTLILSTSCKISGSNFGENYLGLEIGGVKIDQKRVLTKNETQIATRICAATMLKRSLFKTYETGTVKLEFGGSRRVCGATMTDTYIPHDVFIVNGSNLINPEFGTISAPTIFTNIIFDNDEVLAPICNAINNNQEVLNAHEDEHFKFGVNFKTVNSKDIIEWVRAVKETNNHPEYVLESNSAWINTNLSDNDRRRIGLELTRERVQICEDGSQSFLKKDFTIFK